MTIDWHAVLAVLSVYVIGVVIPGPNFVAVAHKAASTTRHAALAMVAGIVSVNLFWASCAILGVGIVFAAFPWIALAVKLTGAAYLILFGSRLVLHARSTQAGAGSPGTRNRQNARDALRIQTTPAARAATADASRRRAFTQGVATNLANPKSIALFAAVFASAAPTHVSWPTFAAMLSVVFVIASSWYGGVAITLSNPGVAGAYRRGKAWVDRVCGAIIVALGLRQLLS